MIGTSILVIVLFIVAVEAVTAVILLRMTNPVKRIAARTVPRQRIPADWNRIMRETKIEKAGRKK